MAAAAATARHYGWPVSIAVLDDAGTPILVSRLDDATPMSFDTAIEKARSAALTGVSTKVLEATISERPALVTLDRVAVEGGLPLLHLGQRVGGIGVSGVKSDQDAIVAQSGVLAFNSNSAKNQPPPASNESDVASIRDLERKRGEALVAGDYAELSTLLADDLVHVHANGQTENKATYLVSVKANLDFVRISRPSFDVRCYGDVALSTGVLEQTVRIRANNAVVELRAATSQVWVKRDNRWLQSSFQATRLE